MKFYLKVIPETEEDVKTIDAIERFIDNDFDDYVDGLMEDYACCQSYNSYVECYELVKKDEEENES